MFFSRLLAISLHSKDLIMNSLNFSLQLGHLIINYFLHLVDSWCTFLKLLLYFLLLKIKKNAYGIIGYFYEDASENDSRTKT